MILFWSLTGNDYLFGRKPVSKQLLRKILSYSYRKMAKEVKRLSSWFSKTISDLKRERVARRRSREIDVMLKRTSQEPVVIYVCGLCQSGKSTFIKQMRIIHGPEFSHQELLECRQKVYKNIIKGMQVWLEQKNRLGIPWQDAANETHELLVNSVNAWNMDSEPQTFQRYVNAINSLWKDAGIQETYSKCVEMNYWLTKESVKYFLHNMNRIGQMSYIPCHQDILYLREHKMDFIILGNIMINASHYMQRYCVISNTTLLFIAASTEYDQVSFEEENSLVESLRIFKVIIDNRVYINNTIILFLNKTDLLAEKVKTADIRKNFPEFRGDPHSLDDVQRFLVQCFRQKIENDSRPFYHHFTTAVDTENIRIAFDSVKDIIMQRNLNKVTFL